jgi:hypothetical protein
VLKSGRLIHWIDCNDKSNSNWLRYVNFAVTPDKQNLIAYQCEDNIYYKTCCDIRPKTELLVWYGVSYAQELGLIPNAVNASTLDLIGLGMYRLYQLLD